MINLIRLFFLFAVTLLPCRLWCAGMPASLAERIDSILSGRRMTVGVSAECGDFSYVRNARVRFPLMSVFKVHVAMKVLADMSESGTSLDTVVHVERAMLRENTYSPLRDARPSGDVDITLAGLMRYSVAESDNNACDILIRMAGGIGQVDRYVRSLGVDGFRLMHDEDAMHRDITRCYDNWSTPEAMTRLMKIVFEGSAPLYAPLRSMMAATVTGADKIRAGVPESLPVAHKTGSSDRIAGIKTGDNDVAVVRMPSGRNCYITVFIKDSAETDAVNAAVIAAVAREIVEEVTARGL